jgi:predicted Zn-dependent protease
MTRIFEPEVYNHVQSIVDQICNSNSKFITRKPFVLIDRSSAVNAYAIGGNVLAVNLGLIDFA